MTTSAATPSATSSVYNGRMLALNGGTLNIESPLRYNLPARQLLQDVGIDLDRFVSANARNRELYRSHGLAGSALFFDKETWGVDKLVVRGGPGGGRGRGDAQVGTGPGSGQASRGGGGRGGAYTAEFLAQTPLSAKAREDMLRLNGPLPDFMPGLSSAEKKVRLAKMSYEDFVLNIVKVDKQVLWFYQNTGAGQFLRRHRRAAGAVRLADGAARDFSGMNLEPTPNGVLADLPGGQHGRQNGAGGGGDDSLPRRQRHDRAAARAMADPRRGAGQDHGGRGRGARQLRAARSHRAAGANSTEQHRRERPPRWRRVERAAKRSSATSAAARPIRCAAVRA